MYEINLKSFLGGRLVEIAVRPGGFSICTNVYQGHTYINFPIESEICLYYQCGTIETYKSFGFYNLKMMIERLEWKRILENMKVDGDNKSFVVDQQTFRMSQIMYSKETLYEYGTSGLTEEEVKRIWAFHEQFNI